MSLFVSFEGPEGSGKTTQIRLLSSWLADSGHNVLTTREPGGTRIGDQIRWLLLESGFGEISPETETLLFSAARAQIVAQVIRPHLSNGGVVLCDRFADSTLAYQGYGRGMDLDTLRGITSFATGALMPDLTVYLDLPIEQGLQRKRHCAEGEWNRMEREHLAFHERLRRGYLALAAAQPERWEVLDAQRSVEEIQDDIRSAVAGRLKPAPTYEGGSAGRARPAPE
jgi:dTMP kinase